MNILLQTDTHYQLYHSDPVRAGRFGDIKDIVDTQSSYTILLDEDSFQYFSYTITLTSIKPFTIGDLKWLIKQKLYDVKKQCGRPKIIYHYLVDQCFYQGSPTNHILGKTGDISCILRVFVLKHDHMLFRKHHLSIGASHFIPKHLWVIKSLGDKLWQARSYVDLREHQIDCFMIEWWWYSSISIAPFGLSLLRNCFKEHDIAPYLYNDIQRLQKNTLLQKTVLDGCSFFLQHLVSRLYQHSLFHKPLLIDGEFSQHEFFMDTFQSLSKPYHSSSILPLSPSMVWSFGEWGSILLAKSRLQAVAQ